MRVAVTGAAGLLGSHLVARLLLDGHEVVGLSRPTLDLEDPASLRSLTFGGASVVVHAAAWTDVDGCAQDPERAMNVNGHASAMIAERAVALGAHLLYVSTNEVFDGTARRPYRENDLAHPINPYAASKRVGEQAVLAAAATNVVMRTAWIHDEERGFPARIRRAGVGGIVRVVDDEWGNPTPGHGLAAAMSALLSAMQADGAPSVIHVAGEPAATRFEWATAILQGTGIEVQPIASSEFRRASQVPARAVLSTELAASLGLPPIRWGGQEG